MNRPFVSSVSLNLNTVTVESSALAKVAYDNTRAIFQVEFRDGTVYQYLGVPGHTYQALLGANSKGDYFNRHIRSSFPHQILCAAVAAS
jgi:KTSC domain